MITSIQTRGGSTAMIFFSSAGANFHTRLSLAKLTEEEQAAWSTALGYANSAVLADGETIKSVQLHPLDSGVIEEEQARDLIEISLSIKTVDNGQRYADLTSELLPSEIRDGLLALYAGLKAKTPEELRALE